MQDAFSELLDFIRLEILGEGENIQLDRNISLEADLGVSGIDAEKFIVAFAKRFNIDVSDFEIDDYFEPEASFLNFKKKSRKDFTIRNLEAAILNGKLK